MGERRSNKCVPDAKWMFVGTKADNLDYCPGADGKMPIFRYFAVVGASLLALLFLTGSYLPPPVSGASNAPIDKSTIRITSKIRTSPPILIDGNQKPGS